MLEKGFQKMNKSDNNLNLKNIKDADNAKYDDEP